MTAAKAQARQAVEDYPILREAFCTFLHMTEDFLGWHILERMMHAIRDHFDRHGCHAASVPEIVHEIDGVADELNEKHTMYEPDWISHKLDTLFEPCLKEMREKAK